MEETAKGEVAWTMEGKRERFRISMLMVVRRKMKESVGLRCDEDMMGVCVWTWFLDEWCG